MAVKEPKEASTRRQLRTIRRFLRKLKLSFRERYLAKTDESYFTIRSDSADVVTSMHLVHQPGLLTIYAVFGVKAGVKRMRELLQLARIFNECHRDGCLLVEADGSVVYRGSIDYRSVKDLDEKYIASLLQTVFDVMDTIDVPLILITKGKTAAAALDEVWQSTKPAKFR